MIEDEEITLRVSQRDAGRILLGIAERRRKLQRGVGKFAGETWDAEKGANMLAALEAYKALEDNLKGQI